MISAFRSVKDEMQISKDVSSAERKNPYEEIEKYLAEAKEEILTSLSDNFHKKHFRENRPTKFEHSTNVDFALPRQELRKSSSKSDKISIRSSSFNNGNLGYQRGDDNSWSQDILKEFQFLVNEEIKNLLDHSQLRVNLTPNGKYSSCKSLNRNHDLISTSNPNPDLAMGGSNSSFRDPSQWSDNSFRTYTLPRSNQRSISLLGDKLLASHPDYQNDPCRLIKVSRNRLSRSHSFDEGHYINSLTLQHLHLIHEAQKKKEESRHSSLSPSAPEGVYGKIRKSGVSHFQSPKWEKTFDEKYPRSDFEDSQTVSLLRHQLEYSTPELFLKNPSSNVSKSGSLTIESIQDQSGEDWRWADEEEEKENSDLIINLSVLEKDQSSIIEESILMQESSDVVQETLFTCPKIVDYNTRLERKSEPTLSRAPPSSPVIGLPGLELRRHTLPNSSSKHLEINDTPVFSTLSWQTLPPDEEMEIMEEKPIQSNESPSSSHPTSGASSSAVRSLNNSLSSLSQLSICEDFSENELNCNDVNDSNVDDRETNSKNKFSNHTQVYYQQCPTESIDVNCTKSSDKNILKDVFVDTMPVLIQLSSGDVIRNKGESLTKQHKTKEVNYNSKTVNSPLGLETNSITGVLQLNSVNESDKTAMILSVSIPEETIKVKTLNREKCLNNTDREKIKLEKSALDDSDLTTAAFLKSKDGKQSKTDSDIQKFLKEVETRIPSEAALSLDSKRRRTQCTDNNTPTAGALHDASTQTIPSPVCGSPTSSFAWLSDYDRVSLEPCTSSMGLSCADDEDDSDELDDDYWWINQESFSSSPPMTSTSPIRDDSSLSLSESLDFLDQNGESGIGTVSTRTSTSPPVVLGTLDFSGSNLSSEDTGLETSFEQKVKRYLPNAKFVKNNNSFYYKKRKPRLRQSDQWIRREHQMTQTDTAEVAFGCSEQIVGRSIRASSEGAPSLKQHMCSNNHLRRLTTSEPRLSDSVSPYMRVANSETVISRCLCSPPLLPTLSEGQSLGKREQSNLENYFSVKEVLDIQSKAISAPLLQRRISPSFLLTTNQENAGHIQYRTQSANEMFEIEALEACKWLRAAGFPQYAQMYEDFRFPLDLLSVERDHSFLDVDSLQALFRRLRILNRCAKIRLDSSKKSSVDDSEDEEEECALSGNWQFQRHSRRWSRIDPTQIQLPGGKQTMDVQASGSVRGRGISEGSDEANLFKRSGSERLKDGAKALLRRMESLKNKKKKRHRDGIVIGSPKVLDEALMQVRMDEMGCVDISPDASPEVRLRGNTQFRESRQASQAEDSSSLASDQSQSSTPRFRSRRKKKLWRRGTSGEELGAAYSDSECSPHTWRYGFTADSNSKLMTLFKDQSASCRVSDSSDKPRRPHLRHATSLTYGRESQKIRDSFVSSLRGSTTPEATPVLKVERQSIYDNVPLIICNKNYQEFLSSDAEMGTQGSGSSECTMESRESPVPQNEEDERPVVRRVTIDRWHSFNRKSLTSFKQLGTQINTFSVGQMNHLRRRALLKLTALMERHCPSNRTAWNWELPKFMRKMKTPDYKDKTVFGVPLQVINQRMGHPLPPCIQQALAYLKSNCLGQVGIFRKPGVRSRIQKLREMHEASDMVDYSTFGPCDIADLVKTYFRELPEVLLTNKLSEIFITICQYLPMDVRLEALQCVMLMMPDENRESLMTLLSFLSDVAANCHLNQMTASNLAVCMAPSLFHLQVGGSSASPLRRKATGTPEQKDLHDNKAAHQCLTLMIQQMVDLQCVPAEMLSNCRFSYLDLSQPVALDDLGSATNLSLGSSPGEGDWSSYMSACITSLLKETRDRNRGWVNVSHPDDLVEIVYRKVGDGHPLRLWKVTTEVEAPPSELLARVLSERHLWDDSLLKWRCVSRLGRQAEIFQYMCNAMPPRAPIDFCVLRCWRNDLTRGICVVVETSVEHGDAPMISGVTRGIVLASRYFIQPCGSGKSKITHISRIDMRGRLPEWYNKNYAHLTASHIIKLRQSFRHFAVGPESKV